MIKKIYPYILIVLGSILEIYYYYFRFEKDGVNEYVSIIIAISLTALLTLLAAYAHKKLSWLIIIPLSLFSIATTSSGQSFSLGEVRDIKTSDMAKELIRNDEIEELQKEIKYLNIEYEGLLPQIAVTDVSERYYWEGVVTRAQSRIDEIREEKKDLQSQINEIRELQTTHEEITTESETDIYIFYNKLFGINVRWSQFILQTILSFFITIMAPIGMVLISNNKPVLKENKQEKPQSIPSKNPLTREKIKLFVTISWAWFRHDKNKNIIIPYENFEKHMQIRKQQNKPYNVNKSEWNIMFKELINNKIVDTNGMILYNGDYTKIVDLLENKLRGRIV